MIETVSGFFGVLAENFSFLIREALFSETFWAALGLVSIVLFADLHRRGYRFSWPRRMVEGVLANLSFYAINLAFAPAIFLTANWFQAGYDSLSVPHVDTAFWDGVSPWLMVPLAVIAYDFADYWNHRILHVNALWPIHAIHHSDPDVTGLTSYRVHFLEPVVMFVSYSLLLSWFGFPPDVLGYGALFLGLHNIYVHINVDWGHGPLRYVLASPRFHRWHHADVPEAHGKNLANRFPVFDLMFGTYYMPGSCREAVGASGVPQNDVVKLFLYPFAEWRRMVLEKTARSPDQGRDVDPSEIARPTAR